MLTFVPTALHIAAGPRAACGRAERTAPPVTLPWSLEMEDLLPCLLSDFGQDAGRHSDSLLPMPPSPAQDPQPREAGWEVELRPDPGTHPGVGI